jgi:replicative DNA helicase
MSGESGQGTLQETAIRVCAAKGVELAAANVLWEFQVPQLADTIHLTALQDALKEAQAEVVILDPLYLALLAGAGPNGPQASNMYQMGPLLLGVAKACLSVGCTPILAHHFKNRGDPYREPQLEDLAYSGIREFSRQWILLGRREEYEAGTGSHLLHLSVGGSAGHSGLWALDIEEGVVDDQFRGRRWEVAVKTAGESRQAKKTEREQEKQQKNVERDEQDNTAVLHALDALSPDVGGVGLGDARAESRLSRDRFDRAVSRLRRAELIEECWIEIATGNGAKRQSKGIKRQDEGA